MTSKEADEKPWWQNPRLITQVIALATAIGGSSWWMAGLIQYQNDAIATLKTDLASARAQLERQINQNEDALDKRVHDIETSRWQEGTALEKRLATLEQETDLLRDIKGEVSQISLRQGSLDLPRSAEIGR